MADFAVNDAQISQTGDSMFAGYLDPVQAQLTTSRKRRKSLWCSVSPARSLWVRPA